MKPVVFALLLGTLICAAEEKTDTITRPAEDITLQLKDDKKSPPIHIAAAPYISGDVITLYPGDKILVEFDIVGGHPKNPRVIKRNTHPERTLELAMTQDKDITAVSRKSGFSKNLTMDCYFLTLGSDFKNHANMYPLDKLPSFDSFEPTTYCIKLYTFDLSE